MERWQKPHLFSKLQIEGTDECNWNWKTCWMDVQHMLHGCPTYADNTQQFKQYCMERYLQMSWHTVLENKWRNLFPKGHKSGTSPTLHSALPIKHLLYLNYTLPKTRESELHRGVLSRHLMMSLYGLERVNVSLLCEMSII